MNPQQTASVRHMFAWNPGMIRLAAFHVTARRPHGQAARWPASSANARAAVGQK